MAPVAAGQVRSQQNCLPTFQQLYFPFPGAPVGLFQISRWFSKDMYQQQLICLLLPLPPSLRSGLPPECEHVLQGSCSHCSLPTNRQLVSVSEAALPKGIRVSTVSPG